MSGASDEPVRLSSESCHEPEELRALAAILAQHPLSVDRLALIESRLEPAFQRDEDAADRVRLPSEPANVVVVRSRRTLSRVLLLAAALAVTAVAVGAGVALRGSNVPPGGAHAIPSLGVSFESSGPAVAPHDIAPALSASGGLPSTVPAPSVDPQSSTPRAASAGASSSESRDEPFLEEDRLMRRAREAVGSNPAQALSLTQEHARRFPRGTLSQEREVIAIDALVQLGRSQEARARATAFLKFYPRSAHRARIEQLVGGEHP